jgi:hypothetical protein
MGETLVLTRALHFSSLSFSKAQNFIEGSHDIDGCPVPEAPISSADIIQFTNQHEQENLD